MKILAIGDFHGRFPEKLREEAKKADLVISVGDHTGIDEWKQIVLARLNAVKKGESIPSPEEILGKKKFKRLLEKDFNKGKAILTLLNGLGKKVFLIFGNSDDEWYKYPFDKDVDSSRKRTQRIIKRMKNIKVITYKSAKYKNINFIGFGGYMDIDAYFSEEPFKNKSRINRRKKSRQKFFNTLQHAKGKKIFIFHYPPSGIFDIIHDRKDNPMNNKSAGIRFFAEAIKRYKPAFALCGHMHEYQGVKKLYNVPVINPGAAHDGKAAVIDFDEKKAKVGKIRFVR
jgi:Icc-related predicted phosphoesterase